MLSKYNYHKMKRCAEFIEIHKSILLVQSEWQEMEVGTK